MTYSDMALSCEIFEKYGLDDFFEADHDIIYGPGIDTNFSDVDSEKLESLGWHKDDEYDCWCAGC